jgi:hypothetical protein
MSSRTGPVHLQLLPRSDPDKSEPLYLSPFITGTMTPLRPLPKIPPPPKPEYLQPLYLQPPLHLPDDEDEFPYVFGASWPVHCLSPWTWPSLFLNAAVSWPVRVVRAIASESRKPRKQVTTPENGSPQSEYVQPHFQYTTTALSFHDEDGFCDGCRTTWIVEYHSTWTWPFGYNARVAEAARWAGNIVTWSIRAVRAITFSSKARKQAALAALFASLVLSPSKTSKQNVAIGLAYQSVAFAYALWMTCEEDFPLRWQRDQNRKNHRRLRRGGKEAKWEKRRREVNN